jgi:hypothetical protein
MNCFFMTQNCSNCIIFFKSGKSFRICRYKVELVLSYGSQFLNLFLFLGSAAILGLSSEKINI